MVVGLEIFRDRFASYADQYVLIGGVACSLALEDAGAHFRVTSDLDIVLCTEAQSPEFVAEFWKFVKDGGYEIQQKGNKKQFFRFKKPKTEGFPRELELFSRLPDALDHDGTGPFTPVPIDADVSSLSAILLDSGYYEFLQKGKSTFQGLPTVGAVHLIPLKARAWLDMTERRAKGDKIDSDKIKKHKLDVFRLYAIIDPSFQDEMPPQIKQDMQRFLDRMQSEEIDLKVAGLANLSKDEVLVGIRESYCR
ncbi:MAG: hypothetical protein ACKV0T_23730 [Planctomycetales bacterium]